MTTAPSNQGQLAFGDFLAHLRRRGFAIGVDHHLRLQRLLDEVGGRCAPQDLKTLLCPVFATNEKEQELFYRAFDDYFELFRLAAPPKPERDLRPDEREEPRPATRRSRWRSPLAYTLLAVLIVALAVFAAKNPQIRKWFGQTPPSPTPAQTPAPPTPTIQQPATTASTAPSATPAPFSIQPISLTPASFWTRRKAALRWFAILAPLLVFLINELIRYRRRRLILERTRGRRPPFTWPINVPAPELKDFRSERFYRAARGLRRRQMGEFHRLDVARTIAATVEARGYPTFRYRVDSRVAEYLILIDRASWRDHQARLFDSLAEALQREGVFPDREPLRFFFDGDPRVCSAESEDGDIHLADLQKKYPAHRLLVFGNGERLLNPVSGEIESWAAMFEEWSERALLTPEPVASWGLREKHLAQHFLLLPATIDGLVALTEVFDLPVAPEFDFFDLDGDPPPPDSDLPITVEDLRDYLGEDAFQWLCACAVYPELHWDLTLYLGSLPCMGAALIGEKSLLRLIRLPWFRAGAMPDELRLDLIGELDPQREGEIRSAIIGLLEKDTPPEKSFAAAARQLEIAVQRSLLSRRDRQKFQKTLPDLKKRFPPSEIARDYVLARFLESAPSSRLAFLLPGRLKRLFYEKGIRAFGLKTWVRALATLVVIAVALAAFSILGRRKPVDDAMWYEFTEVRLDARGAEVARNKGRARYLVEDLGGGVKLEMTEIPSGTFTMGSPSTEVGRFDWEGPQHQVTVQPFAMGIFEVTQAQWRAVMGANPSYFRGDNLPVDNVSWNDAKEFCRKLSQMTGKEYRLPTEAEWEYAARAGTTTPFAFGETITPEIVNYDGNYPYASAPKGEYRGKMVEVGGLRVANAFGLYDMHGNVWEWCEDQWHDSYVGAPTDGSAWVGITASGSSRVIRGGSWNSNAVVCRSANRYGYAPGYRDDILGFRLLRTYR